MTDIKRLESRLTAAIKLAQDLYEDAEPISIWDKFYKSISILPIRQQLLISGEALKELAHVTLLKSESVQADYGHSSASPLTDADAEDDIPDDAGSFLSEDWLNNLVLKTSSLDLTRFAKPDTRLRLPGEELLWETSSNQEDSERSQLESSPDTLEQVLAIAHSESVSDWRVKIMEVLENEDSAIDFWLLREKTQLSPSALFLGLFGSDDWYMKKNEEAPNVGGYGSIWISLTKFKEQAYLCG